MYYWKTLITIMENVSSILINAKINDIKCDNYISQIYSSYNKSKRLGEKLTGNHFLI